MKTFRDKVLGVVERIKKGKVMTYKEVASKAGSPKAFRAVGSILKQNYDPKIPCHRVIPTQKLSGKEVINVGEYNRGKAKKLKLLRAEGAVK